MATKVKQATPLAIWEPRFSTFKVKCPTCWRTLYHNDRDYLERCIEVHMPKCDRSGIV